MTSLLGAFTGWLLFAALLLALGSLTAHWVVIPRVSLPADDDMREYLDAAATHLGWLGSGLMCVAMAFVFARQLVEFHDPFATWREDATILMGTDWGRTWRLGMALSLAAPVAYAGAYARPRMGWPVATAIVLGLAAFPALTGHAAGTEGLRTFTLLADTLHVIGAGMWMGGLAFVLYGDIVPRLGGAEAGLLPQLVPAFSPVAIAGVTVLISTGVLASWVHLDSFGALLTTRYGNLLVLKVVLASLVIALGAINWKRLTPQLDSDLGPAALRRAASMELVIAQVVLLVTAILVRTSPLGH